MPRLLFAALLAGLAVTAAQAQPQAQAPAPKASPTTGPAPGAAIRRAAPSADANNDGKLTLAEMEAVEHRGLISRLDIDRNGGIDRAEFKNLVDFMTKRGGEAGGKQAAALFLVLDADKNGIITQAERDAATKRRFQMVDANHDGWLSKAEVAASGQMRPRAN